MNRTCRTFVSPTAAAASRRWSFHHHAAAMLVLLGTCSLAVAQAVEYKPALQRPSLAMGPDQRLPAAPQVRHEHGVSWVTGGVGLLERQRTIEAGRDMNLELGFARAPQGTYLAGVDVTISDSRGREVLSVDNADPLLFVQLPAGTYRVEARFDGRSIDRRVEVPAHGQHAELLHWRGESQPPN